MDRRNINTNCGFTKFAALSSVGRHFISTTQRLYRTGSSATFWRISENRWGKGLAGVCRSVNTASHIRKVGYPLVPVLCTNFSQTRTRKTMRAERIFTGKSSAQHLTNNIHKKVSQHHPRIAVFALSRCA
jgi:hypothetical protein